MNVIVRNGELNVQDNFNETIINRKSVFLVSPILTSEPDHIDVMF